MTSPRFEDFTGLWVLLCTGRDLPAGKPLAFAVAGERILLFRDESGRAAALVDRCPHRGVALSLGRIEAGEVVCPFHGWRFDGAGRCRHVPWNPDARLAQLGATALPVRELAGTIWLYTETEAIGAPGIPEVFERPDLRVTAQSFVWEAHWTRVMENMLDTPHLPFVHARTIGKSLRGRTAKAMTMRWNETSSGAEILMQRQGEPERISLRYHFPNIMELAIDPAGRVLRLFAVCTPATPGTTRLTIYTVRSFLRSPLFDPLMRRANARIAAEDRLIVESSHPSEVPSPGAEKSVATDAPTLAFRKIWFERIRGRTAVQVAPIPPCAAAPPRR